MPNDAATSCLATSAGVRQPTARIFPVELMRLHPAFFTRRIAIWLGVAVLLPLGFARAQDSTRSLSPAVALSGIAAWAIGAIDASHAAERQNERLRRRRVSVTPLLRSQLAAAGEPAVRVGLTIVW